MSNRSNRSFAGRLPIAAAVVAATLLGACSEPLPLTRDYRDEEEDSVARGDYYETSALTYYEGGRYAEAVRMWDRVLEANPNHKKAQWGKARALMGLGDFRSLHAAIPLLETVIQKGYSHTEWGDRTFEVQRDLGNVYSEIADHYERQIVYGNDRLENDPNADVRDIQDKIDQLTIARNDALRKAIPLYERANNSSRELREDGQENLFALAGLAKAHIQLGNDEVGVQYGERYIAQARTSMHRWRDQMVSWEEQVGPQNFTADQRKVFVDKIFGKRESIVRMQLMLGAVHMKRRQFGSAAAAYSEVIDLDGSIPAAYVERAQAFAMLGQYGRAVEDVEEYLMITDPVSHREDRIKAGELLDRYNRVLAQGPTAARPGGAGAIATNQPELAPGVPSTASMGGGRPGTWEPVPVTPGATVGGFPSANAPATATAPASGTGGFGPAAPSAATGGFAPAEPAPARPARPAPNEPWNIPEPAGAPEPWNVPEPAAANVPGIPEPAPGRAALGGSGRAGDARDRCSRRAGARTGPGEPVGHHDPFAADLAARSPRDSDACPAGADAAAAAHGARSLPRRWHEPRRNGQFERHAPSRP